MIFNEKDVSGCGLGYNPEEFPFGTFGMGEKSWAVVYFPDPKQSLWSKFWNGIEWKIYSLEYINEKLSPVARRLTKRALNGAKAPRKSKRSTGSPRQ